MPGNLLFVPMKTGCVALGDNCCYSCKRVPQLCWLAGFDDLGKTANFEAGAADQGSIDIRLAQQLLGVCRLHTTTILDANLVSRCLVREFFED